MEFVQSTVDPDTVLVRVAAGELLCFQGKPLPYATYLGTISRATRKVIVWTPAADTPRGYHSAAIRALHEMAARLPR